MGSDETSARQSLEAHGVSAEQQADPDQASEPWGVDFRRHSHESQEKRKPFQARSPFEQRTHVGRFPALTQVRQ